MNIGTSMEKSTCYGCQACADICPSKCVSMIEDKEGFLYPHIDSTLCSNCGLCAKVCPFNYDNFSDITEENVWVGRYDTPEVLFNSSSGGAFTAIYESLIIDDYIIYGVGYDENMKVFHSSATTIKECEAFRKSKYVLSDTNHCYSKITHQLKEGRKILFTGTPCQCAALVQYLKVRKIDVENLILVDLICHGAPNQQIFDSHIKEISKDGKVSKFCFKSKQPINGKVNSRTAEIKYASGVSRVVTVENDAFLKGYYGRLFYRPSCGSCKFARIERVSDLTIGDAWGIEELYPEWNSLEGVSLIIANTNKGKKLVENIDCKMTLRKSTIEWAVKNNSQLRSPTEMHKNRDMFFLLWKKVGLSTAVDRSMHRSFVEKCWAKIKRSVHCLKNYDFV